jgi:hypothetical protein
MPPLLFSTNVETETHFYFSLRHIPPSHLLENPTSKVPHPQQSGIFNIV